MRVKAVPVDLVGLPAHLLRQSLDQQAIIALANSIAREGLLQPIIVLPVNDHYLLLDGYRRLLAHRHLRLQTIDAHVVSPKGPIPGIIALIANTQREDIDPLDMAIYYKLLQDQNGLTLDQVATAVGKDRTTISHALGLLTLPQEIQQMVKARTLSPSVALDLKRLPTPEKQLYYARLAVEYGITVSKARYWVQQELAQTPLTEPGAAPPPKPVLEKSLAPTGAPCGVCGQETPYHLLGLLDVCRSCVEALEKVKAEQAKEETLPTSP